MQGFSSLAEVEDAIQHADPQTRHQTLRAVTDLFLNSCKHLRDEHIHVFDDVFETLVEGNDCSAVIETSRRLAPVENSPPRIVRRLASDESIEVAGPMLQFSPRLTTADLRELATTRGDGHLLAISKRMHLEEAVTDVLVNRGSETVAASVAGNTTAQLSKSGLQELVRKAENHDGIASNLILRKELSPQTVNDLLVACQNREAERARRIAAAQRDVLLMKHEGTLNDTTVQECASKEQLEHALAGVSLLSNLDFASVESLFKAEPPSGFILVCKAIDLTWSTISMLLKLGNGRAAHSEADMRALYADFMKLSKANADRILRFWNVRNRLGG